MSKKRVGRDDLIVEVGFFGGGKKKKGTSSVKNNKKIDKETAKKKAAEYGQKKGEDYMFCGQTKDAYVFADPGWVDNMSHGVVIFKETGEAIDLDTYEKAHDGKIRFTRYAKREEMDLFHI